MLLIFRKINELNFVQLMDVYVETIYEQGRREYPLSEEYEQRFLAEQENYQYLMECFSRGAICAVWTSEGRYKAALRLEPYVDGFLLTALETAPEARRRGHAEALILSVLDSFPNSPIYSHVSRSNIASAALHIKCGFRIFLRHATFLDGSVSTMADTYVYKK